MMNLLELVLVKDVVEMIKVVEDKLMELLVLLLLFVVVLVVGVDDIVVD